MMLRVLIVDDEPFIIEGMYHIVDWQALGLKIVGHARHGEKALQLLEEKMVDILITDIRMPTMDGLQLISRVRETYPYMDIIVLSGFNEFNYLKEAMKYGIENYLLKPVNVEELTATLNRIIQKLNNESMSMTKQDEMILRQHILTRLLQDNISFEELIHRAPFLQLSINAPFYLCAILSSPMYSSPIEIEKMNKELKHYNSIVIESNEEHQYILILALHSQDKFEVSTMKKLLNDRLSSLKVETYKWSYGSIEASWSGIRQSYLHAKQCCEEHLLFEVNTLDYHQVKSIKLTNAEQTNKQLQEHVLSIPHIKGLSDKDINTIKQEIEHELYELCKLSTMTAKQLKTIVINLMLKLKSEQSWSNTTHLNNDEIKLIMNSVFMCDLLLCIISAIDYMSTQNQNTTKSPVIQQVIIRIQHQYEQPLSLKGLGQEYNIHPVYLGKLFQKETGELFTDYLNRHRIEMAKQKLMNEHLKVHEIALQVGYSEPGYFYRQFKKFVGISPVEFKRH